MPLVTEINVELDILTCLFPWQRFNTCFTKLLNFSVFAFYYLNRLFTGLRPFRWIKEKYWNYRFRHCLRFVKIRRGHWYLTAELTNEQTTVVFPFLRSIKSSPYCAFLKRKVTEKLTNTVKTSFSLPFPDTGHSYKMAPRRGQTTPLMFHEGYICLVYIFLNQVWQMSFHCSPVYFKLEVATKCQIMTS